MISDNLQFIHCPFCNKEMGKNGMIGYKKSCTDNNDHRFGIKNSNLRLFILDIKTSYRKIMMSYWFDDKELTIDYFSGEEEFSSIIKTLTKNISLEETLLYFTNDKINKLLNAGLII